MYCKIRKRHWNLDMVRCWWGFRIINNIISYTKYAGIYFLREHFSPEKCFRELNLVSKISVHFPKVRNSSSNLWFWRRCEASSSRENELRQTHFWTPTYYILPCDMPNMKNMKTFPKASVVVGDIFWAGPYIVHQRITRFENLKSTNWTHI